jgi:thymidine phosphorylase
VRCLAKPGDRVTRGQPVLELHSGDERRFERALEALTGAMEIGSEPVPPGGSLVIETSL